MTTAGAKSQVSGPDEFSAPTGSSRFAVFAAAARGSFVRPRVTSCGQTASRRIRSRLAKRLLRMPGRVFGTHRPMQDSTGPSAPSLRP